MENQVNDIKNPELKKAIEEMQADNNSQTVNAMIDWVMKAKFITPANVSKAEPVAKNNGTGTVMQQQTQIQFQLVENQNKDKFLPAFTDMDERDKWKQSQGKHHIIMDFDSYHQVLADPKCPIKGIVINPFGRSVSFPKDMIMSLKKQKDAKKSSGALAQEKFEAKNVHLGDPDPDEYPIDMMAAIINFLQERDDVEAAYLRTFTKGDDNKQSYLVIVDFTGDKMEEIFKGISAFASPYLKGYQLSMMPYSVPFAQKAVAGVEPFFEK